MNILVYDIAAEEGGAVSVLKAFYEQHKEDKQNRYVYLLSTYHLEETDNITVIIRRCSKNIISHWTFEKLAVISFK